MKQMNKVILQEGLALRKIVKEEAFFLREEGYSIYHSHILDLYQGLLDSLNAIIDFHGHSDEEFLFYVSNLNLEEKQNHDFLYLRSKPIYKRAMGEVSLQEKDAIEEVIHMPISNLGKEFIVKGKSIFASKIPEELKEEGEGISTYLNFLLESGRLSQRKWEKLSESLFYIYNYYVSISQGEQLEYEKISDKKISYYDEMAKKRHISLDTQIKEVYQNMRFRFEDIQRLQENDYLKHKRTIQ